MHVPRHLQYQRQTLHIPQLSAEVCPEERSAKQTSRGDKGMRSILCNPRFATSAVVLARPFGTWTSQDPSPAFLSDRIHCHLLMCCACCAQLSNVRPLSVHCMKLMMLMGIHPCHFEIPVLRPLIICAPCLRASWFLCPERKLSDPELAVVRIGPPQCQGALPETAPVHSGHLFDETWNLVHSYHCETARQQMVVLGPYAKNARTWV